MEKPEEYRSSSAIESSTALFELAARGKHGRKASERLVKIYGDAFVYRKRADAADSVADKRFGLFWRKHFRFRMEHVLIFAVVNLRVARGHNQDGFPSTIKESVFAIRAGSQPAASAASSTVALDVSNSIILSAMPSVSKYARTFSIAI